MKERCDHCGKWVDECALVIPNHIPIERQDGSIGICEKCAYTKKYDEKYWMNWFNRKYK